MTDTILLIALVAATILGAVAIVEARDRSWAGWACLVGFGALLLDALR